MFVVAAKFCLRLETPSKLERWYSSKHMTQQFSDKEQTAFMRSIDDNKVRVDVFGGSPMDTSGVNRWNLDSRGRLLLDDEFDATSKQLEMHILNSCAALRHASCPRSGCFDNALTGGDVRCFMETFRANTSARNTSPCPRRVSQSPVGLPN